MVSPQTSLLGFQSACLSLRVPVAFSLGPHNPSVCLSYGTLVGLDGRPSLGPNFILITSFKALSPVTITLVVRTSTYESGGLG